MSSRPSRESGGGVLSFTFLDVLTCTMGSLVLLVVILGQKAAHTRLEDALRNGPRKTGEAPGAPTAQANPSTNPHLAPPLAAGAEPNVDPAKVAAKLAELKQQEAQLAELRAKAALRVEEETARVSHLEEHERRLEHELAKLHITLQRLDEAEKQQSVDQESAERNLERLKQLVLDTEEQIKNLRSEPNGKKSYAIVPYEGKNGTHRRPIYIECTADAAIIQPEGIHLTASDWNGPLRSGNPLASAIRAAREELNARARAAGESELPDAYPLILIRPDGALTYRYVASAVRSWDVQFGYELIDQDWNIEYSQVDPGLAQVMMHAVDQARQRQALLAKVAPRTYGARMPAPGHVDGGSRRLSHSSAGSPEKYLSGGQPKDSFLGAPAGMSSESMDFADQVAMESGDPHYGEVAAKARGAEGGDAGSQLGPGGSGASAALPGNALLSQPPGSVPGTASTHSALTSAGPAPDVHKATREQVADARAGQSGAPTKDENVDPDSSQPESHQPAESAAAKRGANWANAPARRASPITRPIRVVVSTDQIDVVPDSNGSLAGEPAVVSFHQSTDAVLDKLAAAVKEHMNGWGFAGQAMYWRPTLILEVAPGADRYAIRLNDLLRDSGIDVHFQETAAQTAAEPAHARR